MSTAVLKRRVMMMVVVAMVAVVWMTVMRMGMLVVARVAGLPSRAANAAAADLENRIVVGRRRRVEVVGGRSHRCC